MRLAPRSRFQMIPACSDSLELEELLTWLKLLLDDALELEDEALDGLELELLDELELLVLLELLELDELLEDELLRELEEELDDELLDELSELL